MIAIVEAFVIKYKGKQIPRLSFWNPIDDDPMLDYAKFEINLPNGFIRIECAEMKKGVKLPNYCAGNTVNNKFAATLYIDNVPTDLTNGFIPITEENLNKYIR